MAAYPVAAGQKGAHHTLTAGVVDTVTFALAFDQLEILNRDGSAEIYFTVDGSAPSVGGGNSFVLPASVGAAIVGISTSGGTVVKLISAGTPAYSVSAVA